MRLREGASGDAPIAAYRDYEMNADGVVNAGDVPLFVARLLGP